MSDNFTDRYKDAEGNPPNCVDCGRPYRWPGRCPQCLVAHWVLRGKLPCPQCGVRKVGHRHFVDVPEPTRGDGTTSLSLGFEQSLLDTEQERAEPQGEPGWMPLKLRTDL